MKVFKGNTKAFVQKYPPTAPPSISIPKNVMSLLIFLILFSTLNLRQHPLLLYSQTTVVSAGLFSRHPRNQNNGAESCSAAVCLPKAVADTNTLTSEQRQKNPCFFEHIRWKWSFNGVHWRYKRSMQSWQQVTATQDGSLVMRFVVAIFTIKGTNHICCIHLSIASHMLTQLSAVASLKSYLNLRRVCLSPWKCNPIF